MSDSVKELTERMEVLVENVGHALGIMSKQIDDLTQKVELLSETVDGQNRCCEGCGHFYTCAGNKMEEQNE